MSDTNIPPSSADDPVAEETANESPWIMLITMLMMIAGLLFSSMLLYAQTSEAQTPDGEPWLQFASLMEKGSALFSMEKSSEESTNTSSIGKTVANMIPKNIMDRIKWPRLELTGFGSAEGSEGYAVINGTMVVCGEYVGDVKLVEVRTHDVVVELDGQRKVLTVDAQD